MKCIPRRSSSLKGENCAHSLLVVSPTQARLARGTPLALCVTGPSSSRSSLSTYVDPTSGNTGTLPSCNRSFCMVLLVSRFIASITHGLIFPCLFSSTLCPSCSAMCACVCACMRVYCCLLTPTHTHTHTHTTLLSYDRRRQWRSGARPGLTDKVRHA